MLVSSHFAELSLWLRGEQRVKTPEYITAKSFFMFGTCGRCIKRSLFVGKITTVIFFLSFCVIISQCSLSWLKTMRGGMGGMGGICAAAEWLCGDGEVVERRRSRAVVER